MGEDPSSSVEEGMTWHTAVPLGGKQAGPIVTTIQAIRRLFRGVRCSPQTILAREVRTGAVSGIILGRSRDFVSPAMCDLK